MWHIGWNHGWPSDQKAEIMDITFKNKKDLMKHKKKEHTENVQILSHYSCGNDPYGEQNFWFIHGKEHAN